MSEPFLAPETLEGEECYLCVIRIHFNDLVKFYGGPFLTHQSCVEKITQGAL